MEETKTGQRVSGGLFRIQFNSCHVAEGFASLSSKVTTIKTVKQMDELTDIGTDTPMWQRYRMKIISLSQQVSGGDLML